MFELTSLKIQNFESWKKAYFEFDPGTNVIIAKPGIHASDCGKSSIIRAIQWVTTNQPASDKMVSHWAKDEETFVEIKFAEGARIKRMRGKGINCYYLNDKLFEAIGRGIPEEIKKVINFTDLNILTQDNSFFLIKESPGEVARYLNRIVNLQEIDHAQSYADTMVRRASKNVGYIKQEITEKKKEVDSLQWVKEAEKEYNIVYAMERRLHNRQRHLVDVDTLIHKAEEIQQKIQTYKGVLKTKKEITLLLEHASRIQQSEDRLNKLQVMIKDWEYTTKIKQTSVHACRQLKEIYDKTFPEHCPLCGNKVNK